MSDELNKHSPLVNQDEALGCYFDSLLAPQENEPVVDKSALEIKHPLTDSLSAQRRITQGPVSPKPGEPEPVSKKTANSSIVFSEKDKDGQVIEQVLIPRSQRLASLNQLNQDNTIAQSITPPPPVQPETNTVSSTPEAILSKTKPLEKRQETKEPPNLDLSLFLPTIKTLSDDEIARQIEALTQAAQMQQTSQQKMTEQAESDGPAHNSDNAPSWAVPDFQVLLFAVAGLKLAVPLIELNGIVEWGDEYISELPGHASWYLGLIQNQGKNIPVIDTLQQVVPKNRWPAEHLSKRNFKHIILIDSGRWGLACETVLEVITLKTDAVKWRSSRTKRRWLLGTVIDQMCALLDSSEFAAMLETGEDSLIS